MGISRNGRKREKVDGKGRVKELMSSVPTKDEEGTKKKVIERTMRNHDGNGREQGRSP